MSILNNQTRKDLRLEELRVMLIDDNADMRRLVKSLLHAMSIRSVIECGDGGDALQELGTRKIDLIITDWAMEPIDGVEFVKLLRTAPDSPCPRVDVIMLTGNAELDQVIQARNAGVTEFLAKPISAEKLYTRVISVIKHPRPFIQSKGYTGPDRRRIYPGSYMGEERRNNGELLIEQTANCLSPLHTERFAPN